MSELIKHLLRLILLVFFQVTVFNHIGFYGLINPFIYLFFILMLPLATPRSLLMIIGFALGLSIDIFSNTGGLHAMATTLVCFIRPWWLSISVPRSKYDDLQSIRIRDIEFRQFVAYSLFLIWIHHLCLYSVESLEIADTFNILTKSILNSLLTGLLVIVFRYLDFGQRK